ncbi:hypothetical protein FQA39_LY14903 [Lamprigera yunnana]|nr:hypothetical protein FQA39_LY14903 [Lamprigera yunnana]
MDHNSDIDLGGAEAIEEDYGIEMEIDETVPDTPIIENRRDSEVITHPTQFNIGSIKSEVIKKKADDVILILDDDKTEKKRSRVNVEVAQCEVIDLVERNKNTSVNSKCINYQCRSGINMITAPQICLTFYRIKSSKTKRQEVCSECFDMAVAHFEGLMQALGNNELLINLNLPIRNDLVEIDDSDSEDEADKRVPEYLDDDYVTGLSTEIDTFLSYLMERYKIREQCDEALKLLKRSSEEVQQKFEEVDTMMHGVRKGLDTIHQNLYNEFKICYESLPAIDISDVHESSSKSVTTVIAEESPRPSSEKQQKDQQSQPQQQEIERRSTRKTKPISYAELDDIGSGSNSPITNDTGVLKEPIRTIEAINIPPIPPDLPQRGPVQKPPLKINDYYYTVRFHQMGSWVLVKLINILKPGTTIKGQVSNQTLYTILLESKQPNKGPITRLVTGKELAYSHASQYMLDVGARVIAAFRETNSTGESKKYRKESFYPGIIAEPLSYSNEFRYLIFFDDGYAQYVPHKLVHLIYASSKQVWQDMHVDSRLFIKRYLESYPDRHMVTLSKDQTVRTEYNGKWWFATVMAIDCSLVKMFFENSNRVEWIYRGSTRLNPMFREEFGSSEPRNTMEIEPNKGESTKSIRSVARKSTAKSTVPKGKVPVTVPFLPMANPKPDVSILTPPASKVVYFTPRAQANTKLLFELHVCSFKCKRYITYNVKKLNGYNPLSKPLLCGWNRVTIKHKGKREINYKTPCGRFVRNLFELHRYLQTTESEMTVDLFDFDFWVHCLAEFVLERNATINKDMSNGLELVAIPIVNYMDKEKMTFTQYSIKREPKDGVHLNLDSEFLCGCDCEDDCEDKLKCQCWQLTLQGLRYINKNLSPDNVGYCYRRLPEPVATGIYECNSRCKCAATCLNRVVQNPLQLKLQVFKTQNKGWGIRCLNDIPQGAFICIYAGGILTEQMANEGGKNAGDEYLAELDYIEVVEKMKEDYEEEALDDDDMEKVSSKSSEGSIDEEEIAEFNRKKKGVVDDYDFIPGCMVPRGQSNIAYKKRLRKRNADDDDGRDEDDTVIVSDDDDYREPSSFNPKEEVDESQPSSYRSVREMFGKDEAVYIMDAKIKGNIGRFLNHSCSPNVFVQNVFVDTHDLRFPWVAFFALTYIRAGTELTWNYNYDVGSVPGKILYCYCSSSECRGRLL